MIGAFLLGASQAVTKRIQEERAAEMEWGLKEAEFLRTRKNADDSAVIAQVGLINAGKDDEFVVIPEYATGGIKTIALNQYAGTVTAPTELSPDPKLAYYNALSTKEQKIDPAKFQFVKVNPNLTPEVLRNKKFSDGTPVVANKDYILFSNVDRTGGERAITGISSWRNELGKANEALDLALAQAQNGDRTALDDILQIGVDRTLFWQKEQKPGTFTEGKAYYEANPFAENGPLAFMKDDDRLRNELIFAPFIQTVAEESQRQFINSLNELGYNIPSNNPVTYTVDGQALTVQLTGDWGDLKEANMTPSETGVVPPGQGMMWNSDFQNQIGSWVARSDRSAYEWMALLNDTGNRIGKDARYVYDRLQEVESRFAQLGQPVDVTSGVPVYRQSWGRAVQEEMTNVINELQLQGSDAPALVGALMPEDLYRGIRTKVYNVSKSAHHYIQPGLKIEDLRAEQGDLAKNIRLAERIQRTIPAGTGLTAELVTLQAGAADQVRQLKSLFGANPEGLPDTMVGVLEGFFTPDELNEDNLKNLNRADLQLRIRKFATIQLMYSFAKGMGGSGSDRLSDQDAKNALEALQVSGLLNTQEGMNAVMQALINGMSRRQQVVEGLLSGNERATIGAVYLNDLHKGRQNTFITDIVMDTWANKWESGTTGVVDPTTPRQKTPRL